MKEGKGEERKVSMGSDTLFSVLLQPTILLAIRSIREKVSGDGAAFFSALEISTGYLHRRGQIICLYFFYFYNRHESLARLSTRRYFATQSGFNER